MKTKVVVIGAALLVAWALKRLYSGSTADDLWWILTPTARLAGAITATPFAMQAGEGYFTPDRMFLIEKSCAGVNFMIAAFGVLMVALFHRVASPLSAARLLTASLLAGYAATVLVNAVRIAIAMWLAAHPIAPSLLSAAELHRVEGIVVYFGGLLVLHELTLRFDRRRLTGGVA